MTDFESEGDIYIPDSDQKNFQSLTFENDDKSHLPVPKNNIVRLALWHAVAASVDNKNIPTLFSEGRVVYRTANSLKPNPYSREQNLKNIADAKYATSLLAADKLIVPPNKEYLKESAQKRVYNLNTTNRIYTPLRQMSSLGHQIAAESSRRELLNPESTKIRREVAKRIYRIAAGQLIKSAMDKTMVEPLPIELS